MPLSRRSVLGLAAVPFGAGLAPSARAQFRIEISGVGATQIPVAVARMRGEDRLPQPVSDIVRADLERSGQFRLVEALETLDESAAPALSLWRSRGADALLGGSAARLADGRLDLRYRLWDVVRGDEGMGQSLAVPAGDLRLAAHRIADAVYEKLAGERGVFSTRIAYVTRAGNRFTLRVTDSDGEGGEVALASPQPIISPAWSPDGRLLAYVSFETGKAVVWVQDVMTGERRPVANYRGSNSAPAWSPDGRQLAVVLSRDGISQLYVVDLPDGAPRRMTTTPAIDTEPVFTPDGRTIYFVSDRGGGPQIYRMPAAGGNAERVTFAGAYNISPAISPDGKLMAYVTRNAGGAFKVMTVELDAGGTPQPVTDTTDDESPSFAPNGRLIVYATRGRGRGVLMTTTLDGKIRTRLQVSGSDVHEPAWGPFLR